MDKFLIIDEKEIETFYKKISSNIKRVRKERNITQLDLALSVGFGSVTFYTNAENCSSNKHFNLEHLYKIAKVLDVDICEFLK